MWKNGTNFSYKSGSSSFLYQFMLKISAKYGKIRKNSCFSWIFFWNFDIRNVNLLYSSLFEKIVVFLLQLGVCFYARNWLHKIPQRPLAWNNCRDNPILCITSMLRRFIITHLHTCCKVSNKKDNINESLFWIRFTTLCFAT